MHDSLCRQPGSLNGNYSRFTGKTEEEGQIRVRFERVQRQDNGSDCAFFCCAFSAEIALFEINSADAPYTGTRLRQWVDRFFQQQTVVPIPRQAGRQGVRTQLSCEQSPYFITQQDSEGHWQSWEAQKQNPVPATLTSALRPLTTNYKQLRFTFYNDIF